MIIIIIIIIIIMIIIIVIRNNSDPLIEGFSAQNPSTIMARVIPEWSYWLDHMDSDDFYEDDVDFYEDNDDFNDGWL